MANTHVIVTDNKGRETRIAVPAQANSGYIESPMKHVWVPLADCGDLESGMYDCSMGYDDEKRCGWDGYRWRNQGGHKDYPKLVLSPHLGPIPSADG